jgi:hypothetical protein
MNFPGSTKSLMPESGGEALPTVGPEAAAAEFAETLDAVKMVEASNDQPTA